MVPCCLVEKNSPGLLMERYTRASHNVQGTGMCKQIPFKNEGCDYSVTSLAQPAAGSLTCKTNPHSSNHEIMATSGLLFKPLRARGFTPDP